MDFKQQLLDRGFPSGGDVTRQYPQTMIYDEQKWLWPSIADDEYI